MSITIASFKIPRGIKGGVFAFPSSSINTPRTHANQNDIIPRNWIKTYKPTLWMKIKLFVFGKTVSANGVQHTFMNGKIYCEKI